MIIRLSAALLGLVSTFAASSPLWAKGDMVRIVIDGGKLVSPVQITDWKTLTDFVFWDGPGNSGVTLGHATSGSIIDWKVGIVAEHPIGLQHYEISFYMMQEVPTPRLVYVVFHEYDASSNRGFVYLPGKGEPGGLEEIDSGSIYRGTGVAGHWFRATQSWADLVGPLVAKAERAKLLIPR